MTNEEFAKVFSDMMERSHDVLCNKAKEYASDRDRLHNFKVARGILGCNKPTTALSGMLVKHVVSLFDMLDQYEKGNMFSKEMWDEKIGDTFNYLILLKAILVEDEERKVKIIQEGAKVEKGE